MFGRVLCLLILIIFGKLKKNGLFYISDTVSGKLPPRKFIHGKFSPIKILPGAFFPGKLPPRIFSLMLLNTPTRVF